MRHLIPLLLFCLSLPAGALPLQDDMRRALAQQQLVGAVWSTVTPAGIVTGAAGLAHAGDGAAMHSGHRVQVGSVAKTALALGVLRLISEGRLTLDTPVAPLLPPLRFNNHWQHSDPVRVRHLLAHTAGLDNSRLWQVFSLGARADTPLAAAFTRDPALLTVQTRPGSRYAYSNIGYGLLGMVIEKISGQPYAAWLDASVLKPLEMHDSTFQFVTQTDDARLAMGHFERGAMQAATRHYLPSADQLTTTAADMGRLARFLMGDGSLGGRAFIAPALMAALGEPDGTEAAQAGLTTGHGLALSVRDRHGQRGYCHPGTTIGYNAMLCVYPRQQKAFFVATNTDNESADYDSLNQPLLRALDLPAAAPVERGVPAADIARWQGLYVPAPYRMSNLAWTDLVFNFMQVNWDGKTLRLSPFQGKDKLLTPSGGHRFTMDGRLDHTHVLLNGEDGQRVVSDGLHSYRQISEAQVALLWASLAAGMLGLLYIVLIGAWRLWRRGAAQASAPSLTVPLIATIALALPVPLFFRQSFLQLGELTLASGALAIVTAALPLALAYGLYRQRRQRRRADTLALAAALQCTLVLAAWGMLPLMLWK